MIEVIKEKVEQSVEILKEKDIDLWITFVRETSLTPDPILSYILDGAVVWKSAFIITSSGKKIAIVGSLDAEEIERKGIYEVVGYVKSIREPLLKILEKENPNKIAINFSSNAPLADGLTKGMYDTLLEILGEKFTKRLVSSEDIINSLVGRKTKKEVELIKNAIDETLKIFEKTSSFIKPGVSEIEIAEFMKEETKKLGADFAWEETHCPSVFTGPQKGGAHSGPTRRLVEKGHVLNIDFGIKLNGYVSDLQRTWYVMRDEENEVPKEVQHAWKTLIEAVELSYSSLKPGVTGYEIDKIAREHIVKNGYPEYPHALGHQVGRTAHDGMALLAPSWERYGNTPFIPLEEGMVFTIEPRISVKGYGVVTVEDIVLITKNGAEFLSEPQREVWIIK